MLEATVGDGLRAAERLAASSSAAMLGAVECGVRTAYSVIDEYMTRGRETASHYGGNHTWSDAMSERQNGERQNYDVWSAAWGPMWPFVAPWMEATRAWAAAMSTPFGRPAGVAPESPPGFPFGLGAPWAPSSARGFGSVPQLSVQLSSESPAEVVLNVMPVAGAMTLTADPLRIDPGSGDAPPLVGVAIGATPSQVRVSMTIPTNQPPGRYTGAIRDSSGMPIGDLTVRVSAPSRGPSL